jgi:hypothetical protein
MCITIYSTLFCVILLDLSVAILYLKFWGKNYFIENIFFVQELDMWSVMGFVSDVQIFYCLRSGYNDEAVLVAQQSRLSRTFAPQVEM